MNIDFANLSRQYQAYKAQIDERLCSVLDRADFIMGEEVVELEGALQEYVGGSCHTIACSSGTDALILSLMALGIGRGDEVITSPFSFFASSEAIAFLGARPVFVDIDGHTYNLDPSRIESAITHKTRAILPISLFGQVAEMDRINEIARAYGLSVIEDASQSFGASYRGRKSCSLSDFATTSFFPSKPLGCYGDGGAVFCRDAEYAQKIRSLLKHGQIERYHHSYVGLNARLDTIQAGILLAKLPFLDMELDRRRSVARLYSNSLQNCTIPTIAPYNHSAFAQYSVLVANRDALRERLAKRGIPTAVHYPLPLHLQEALMPLGYKKGDFPVSEEVAKTILSLPINAFLQEQEIDFIIASFNEASSLF